MSTWIQASVATAAVALVTLAWPAAARTQETPPPAETRPVIAAPAAAPAAAVQPAIGAAPPRAEAQPVIAAAAAMTPLIAEEAQASTPSTPPPPPAAPPPDVRADQDARTPPPPPPPAPAPAAARAERAAQPRPAIAGEAPRAERERPYVSKDVNVRIDATVTETRGDQVLGKKVVSITLRDGDNGSVRSSALVPQPSGPGSAPTGMARVPLNMDAMVWVRDANRVQARITLDYNRGTVEIGDPGAQRLASDSGIRQSVSVILENGKPLVVAQSADPEGDRRVTLELKATILR